MSEDSIAPYVPSRAIQEAVKGREEDILDALGLPWRSGRPQIRCPYPDHGGEADWRWDEKARKARCTCSKSDSIFDVVMKCEGVSFEDAKLRVAAIIGRRDLIRTRRETSHQNTDAASLLSPRPSNRDDALVARYLAHRLGVEPGKVPMPSTAIAGLKALAYFDPPPAGSKAKFVKVSDFPCAVFGTVSADGKGHAHRIYLAPDGAGKAELSCMPNGQPRDPKKSAKAAKGDNTAGRSTLWGAPATAPWIILAEGIETAAAIAFAFRAEIEAGEAVVAAAISAGGVEAFQPWPATQRVTVAADRDEQARTGALKPSRRGEEAARTFGLRHHCKLPVGIALPGNPGESADWLDMLLRDGADAVRAGILSASSFAPTPEEEAAATEQRRHADQVEEIARVYPLPTLDTMNLSYARTASGKVKVHKRVWRKDTFELVPIATPFGVPARLRHLDQADAYGLRIVVQDMGGQPRHLDTDRAMLARMGAAEIRSLLFGAGLRTEDDGESIALQCLKAADPTNEIMILRRPGWHQLDHLPDPVFACPDGEFLGAPPDIALELAAASRLGPAVARGGSLAGWKAAVAAATAIQGCEHWTIGVISAFAGPLIALTSLDTCGINFSGLTSSGKTTAQKLAASAWSRAAVQHRDGLFQSAKTTVNSLEATAARSNGMVLVLDELAHVSGKELGRMIYTLAGGVGKRRMTAEAALRDSYSWATFVVLSAECSLEEKIRADGGDWTGGMAVRIPDLDVTGVNRAVDRATLQAISSIAEHFGHAGPAFVGHLIAEGLHRQSGELRAGMLELAARLAGSGADSARVRAALPFGILSMAGELARGFGLIPQTVDLAGVVSWAWRRFEQSGDARALDPGEMAIASLRTWIAERWGSSIRPANGDEKTFRDAIGWYDAEAVYLPTARLREAAGGTLKEAEIARALDGRGLLAKTKDAEHRFVNYVPKVGRVQAYALSRSEFGHSGLDREPEAFRVYPGARA